MFITYGYAIINTCIQAITSISYQQWSVTIQIKYYFPTKKVIL